MLRKIQKPPPMPEDPQERLEEVKVFRRLLVNEFYDYGFLHVFDSVFRARVDSYMAHVNFNPDDMSIEEQTLLTNDQKKHSMQVYQLGTEIQETDSDSVLLFIHFFKAIEDFFTSVQ